MDCKDISETLAALSPLVEKYGAEKAGKVLSCLTDVHAALVKYDDDIRIIAIKFVIQEASKQ